MTTTDQLSGLTAEQKENYREKGYVILRGLFDANECDELSQKMVDYHDGRLTDPDYPARPDGNWSRVMNPHLFDELSMNWLIHSKLKNPLEDCLGEKVDGIQSMYFYKGSQQGRHQDQYYLPACFAAWIPLVDVGLFNGTIYVQEGSNKKRLITGADRGFTDTQDPASWTGYNEDVDKLFEQNGLKEVAVDAKKGDVVIFDGTLIHKGGPVENADFFRHVIVNHYIPYAYEGWPFSDWPRFSFDGQKRYSNPPGAVKGLKSMYERASLKMPKGA
ncbi:MAG: phytanoyl-CoA dioxygenase family protein [Verrucomicrobiota bacterium]|nr:phytanoyl-CoA dioxygenase family protein [Verrucomicrobiota bacterium]